jgi:hypothetical protein
VGGLFEAVDPGVLAAGESVGEGFFEVDLLFAGRFFEELAVGGRGEAAAPGVHYEGEEGVGAGGEVVGGGGVLEGG